MTLTPADREQLPEAGSIRVVRRAPALDPDGVWTVYAIGHLWPYECRPGGPLRKTLNTLEAVGPVLRNAVERLKEERRRFPRNDIRLYECDLIPREVVR